jgi:hypothetical protein
MQRGFSATSLVPAGFLVFGGNSAMVTMPTRQPKLSLEIFQCEPELCRRVRDYSQGLNDFVADVAPAATPRCI